MPEKNPVLVVSATSSRTIEQFGIVYPNGETQWARGSIEFEGNGETRVPTDLTTLTVEMARYPIDLRAALAGEADLSHLIKHLTDLAESSKADPVEYIGNVKIVTRSVVIAETEISVADLPLPTPEKEDEEDHGDETPVVHPW